MPSKANAQICNKLFDSKELQAKIQHTWKNSIVPTYTQLTGKPPTEAYSKKFMKTFKQKFLAKCQGKLSSALSGSSAFRRRRSRRRRTVRRR
jgi:hypothetical protein